MIVGKKRNIKNTVILKLKYMIKIIFKKLKMLDRFLYKAQFYRYVHKL